MRRGTLLALVLLVGGLLWLQSRRADEEAGAGVPVQDPLLPGLEAERVSAVRVDNLERSVQLKLERDSAGSWFLTDPIAYPALDSIVRLLLQTLAGATGEFDALVDPAEVGLDPPLVVVELTQIDAGGSKQTFRIEVGSVDLDGSRVYVRVPGHPTAPPGSEGVMRGPRTIYTTLDRNPDDYREARITHLLGREVISFRREGQAVVAGLDGVIGEVDLTFHALLGADGWKKVNAPVVTLEPNAVGLLARGAAELRVLSFTADLPSDYAQFGLDPPAFSIELGDDRGGKTTLSFGYPALIGPGAMVPERWFARREGFPHVWELEGSDLQLLTLPAETLYDDLLLRARRQDVRRVDLQGAGRILTIEREPGGWFVSERVDGADPEERPHRYPADLGRVEDIVATLESSHLGEHLPEMDFVPTDPAETITVITQGDVRWGGEIGAPFRDSSTGAAGRLYRRYGDDLCAILHEDAVALCTLELDSIRGLGVHVIRETELRSIRLERDGTSVTYVQTKPTEWRPEGMTILAPREFTDSLGTLLSLRAEAWIDEPPALDDEVTVVTRGNDGTERRFRLGRVDGSPVYIGPDASAALDFAQHVEAYGTDPLEALLLLLED